MKQCTLCNESKPLSEYVKQSASKDGLGHWCKPCRKEKKRAEYLKHRDKYLARAEKQRKEDPERVAEIKKRCVAAKHEEYKASWRRHYIENQEAKLSYQNRYRAENRKDVLEKDRQYKARNRCRLNNQQRQYYAANRDQRIAYASRYVRHRLDTDPMYRLAHITRSRVRLAISKGGYTKRSKTHEILGCDFDTLAQHLEAQFLPGMTWGNRGEWHIDHIIPLASADSEGELLTLCHYTNLQPLWAFDNLSKGAKMR